MGVLLLSAFVFSGYMFPSGPTTAFARNTSSLAPAVSKSSEISTILLSQKENAPGPYSVGYRRGYRQGYRDGQADCSTSSGGLGSAGATSDYNRGFANGYDAGHRAACGD
jgi:hypothetical protein